MALPNNYQHSINVALANCGDWVAIALLSIVYRDAPPGCEDTQGKGALEGRAERSCAQAEHGCVALLGVECVGWCVVVGCCQLVGGGFVGCVWVGGCNLVCCTAVSLSRGCCVCCVSLVLFTMLLVVMLKVALALA